MISTHDLAGETLKAQLETSPLATRLAVRGSFDPTTRVEDLSDLLQLCAVRLHRTDGREEWMLAESVRVAALAHALRNGGMGNLQSLAADQPVDFPGPVQTMFDHWIDQSAWPPLDQLTEDELVALMHVSRWATGALVAAELPVAEHRIPKQEEIEGRLAVLDVTRPIRWLVRRPVVGRDAELSQLRGHVFDPTNGPLGQAPPLCVYGIGGVGKSTLVAAFVDELMRSNSDVLWAYLDFDRRTLQPQQPFTILSDLYRQFGAQDPSLALISSRKRVEMSQRQKNAGLESFDSGGSFRQAAIDLLKDCGQRKIVVVLDSCEEVQRVNPGIEQLYNLMDALASAHPGFKLIISGRSRVPQFEVPGYEWKVLEVGRLPAEAATAVLVRQVADLQSGISHPVDPELAREVVKLVGGNPLSLSVAAQVLANEDLSAIANAAERARALDRVREEYVRGFLYKRVLDHIQSRNPQHRDALRRIARAALALRFITPDVVERILLPLANVPATATAVELYADLTRELAFIECTNGMVRIREDVRRPALAALQFEDHFLVDRVHQAARSYYEQTPTAPDATIEAAYHALSLGDDAILEGLDSHVLVALCDADLPEVMAKVLQTIARGGSARSSDDELRRWEQNTLSQVDAALRGNNLMAARVALFERTDRRPTTELFRLESRLLEAEGDLVGASEAARKDLAVATTTNQPTRASAAAVRLALLLERRHRAAEGIAVLAATEVSTPLTGNGRLQLELILNQLTLAERGAIWNNEERWLPGLRVRKWLQVIGTRFKNEPTLVRLLAAAFGAEEPSYLRLAIQRVGLGDTGRADHIDALAQSVANWDDGRLSSTAGMQSPTVADWRDRLSVLGSDAGELLYRLWTVDTPPTAVRDAIRAIYTWWGVPVRAEVPSTSGHFLDDFPLDFTRAALIEFERILLTIFPTTKELAVLAGAGAIDSSQVEFSAPITFALRDLLKQARERGVLVALVRASLDAAALPLKAQLQDLLGEDWIATHYTAKPIAGPVKFPQSADSESAIHIFQTVAEARERFVTEEPFLPRAADNPFVGREDQLRFAKEFLNGTKTFLLVHGAGGIGKTRLLLELGNAIVNEGEWQVLWANVASLSASVSWLGAIVPEKRTLLLVDEPNDPKLLQVFAEQLGARVGPGQWKIVVAVRSVTDPVLRYLRGPRRSSQVEELLLEDLSPSDSVRMCRGLLVGKVPAEALDSASSTIARVFAGHPVWITLAVSLAERFGDWKKLPTTSQDLAREYIKDIITNQDEFSQRDLETVLRWLSLAGNINREALGTMDLLAERSGVEDTAKLGAIVHHLIERHVLVERGANKRIIEVKPDVIRDRVLIDWLTSTVDGPTNTRVPTKAAHDLATAAIDSFISGTFAFTDRITLTALARSELVLRLDDQRVDLLAPFWQRLKESLADLGAQKRVDVVEVLSPIAPFRPRDIAECVRILRTNNAEPERVQTIFRPKEIGQRDVVLALPWLIFNAAAGANGDDRATVVEELCNLVIAEHEVAGGSPPNDGKRAGQLLQRVLEGGPQFASSFDQPARASALTIIDHLSTDVPTPGEAQLIDALIIPLVSMERTQSWSSQTAVHWRQHVISPDEEAFAIRAELLERVRAHLGASAITPQPSRVLLWKVIVESHRSANASHSADSRIDLELLGDLKWAHAALQRATLEELRAARDLWHWHVQFDERVPMKEHAEALEALYKANDVAGEFEDLLRWDEPSEMEKRFANKAKDLAKQDSSAVIDFLARGLKFLGDAQEVRRLLGVAFQLGRTAHDKPITTDFVKTALQRRDDKPVVEFALEILAGWIFGSRSNEGTSPVELITEWLGWCVDDPQRAMLLQRVFSWYGPNAQVTAEEQHLLRASGDVFIRAGNGAAYVACVSYTFAFEWDQYIVCMTGVLDALPAEHLTHAIALLIDGVDRGLRLDKEMPPPPALGRWVLDQILRLPTLDSIGGNTEWHLKEIIGRVGRLPTQWLLDALRVRAAMEHAEPLGGYGGIGHSVQLADYVTPLSLADRGSTETTFLVDALLAYLQDRGSIGYQLPDILQAIDPDGVAVPDAIAERVDRAVGYIQLFDIARLAEGYAVGTKPWRVIARSVVLASASVDEREQRSLFQAIGDPAPSSWSGTPGEVPPAFTAALYAARAHRDAETDDAFRPYWEWYVSAAQAALDDQSERAKEKRGE